MFRGLWIPEMGPRVAGTKLDGGQRVALLGIPRAIVRVDLQLSPEPPAAQEEGCAGPVCCPECQSYGSCSTGTLHSINLRLTLLGLVSYLWVGPGFSSLAFSPVGAQHVSPMDRHGWHTQGSYHWLPLCQTGGDTLREDVREPLSSPMPGMASSPVNHGLTCKLSFEEVLLPFFLHLELLGPCCHLAAQV